MSPSPPHVNAVRRSWLRRFITANPTVYGTTHAHLLYAIGNAAARETLVTATWHMSAIWTSLFHDLLSPGSELRWLENGPGFGRDARIAYSSLLGRYVGRAYLTTSEGVLTLVPLDVVQRRLKTTPYSIHKVPAGNRGLMADWIGLDTAGRLIIAEAKGSYDRGKGTWHGPTSRPQLLETAKRQAKRTVVRAAHGHTLPARRWAVVSRWGTPGNKLEPTVLASCDDGPPLRPADYITLSRILLDADRRAVLSGLGHADIVDALPSDFLPRERLPGDISLRVRGIEFPPGAAAIAGPFGFRPLRGPDDLDTVDLLVDSGIPQFAVASFSSRRATTFPDPIPPEPAATGDAGGQLADIAELAGLSVAWPLEPTDIAFPDR